MNTQFNKSVIDELKNHIIDRLPDQLDQDFDDLHNRMFNEDYYIVGYYQAKEWLKKHNIDAFECIEYVQEYEISNFGETNTKINSESMVNMFTYILGEEIISHYDLNNFDGAICQEHIDQFIEDLSE